MVDFCSGQLVEFCSGVDILDLAKTANGFWYPQEYVELALYFEAIRGLAWGEAPAGEVLSADYSSVFGWQETVHAALVERGMIISGQQGGGGGGCAV